MEKMDLIQTCVNSRLLEANPSCFTYGGLLAEPAVCEPLHQPAPRDAESSVQGHLGETHCHSPIGVSTQRPPRKLRKAFRVPNKTLWGGRLSLVCKAFTKPPVITPSVLAARGHIAPPPTSSTHTTRQTAHPPRPESKQS